MQMNSTHNLMQINLEVSGDIFENLNEKSLLEKDFKSEMSLLGNEWRRDAFGVSEMKCQRQTAPRFWRDIAAEKKKIFDNFLQLIGFGQTIMDFYPMEESQYM